MTAYNPRDWFWIVGGDESRAWSSAAGVYVADYDAARVTRIVSEAELNDVLRPYGLALPAPTLGDYEVAIQAHIDETARERSYTDSVSLASYKDNTNPQWSSEATIFIAWRDQVWSFAYTTLAKVEAKQQEQPTISGLVDSLPPLPW